MDDVHSNVSTANGRQEEPQDPASLPNTSTASLSFEGINDATIADSNSPLHGLSLPAPSAWLDPPQWAAGIDLSTPKVEELAGTDWTNAPSSSATAQSTMATLPPQDIMLVREPLPHPVKLLGSSQTPPLANTDLNLQTQNLVRNDSSLDSSLGPSPPIASGVPSLRASQSALNMSMTYGGLPERPRSSEGYKKRAGGRTRGARGHSANGSITSLGEATSQENEDSEEKLRISRERNRIAAAKTRRKKKSKAKEIEETAKEVEERNRLLHQEVRTLRDAFSTLRYCALSHDPAEGCTCRGIHQYNQAMAQEVAKDVAKNL